MTTFQVLSAVSSTSTSPCGSGRAACQACGDCRPVTQLVQGRRPFPLLPNAWENVVFCVDRRFCSEAFSDGPDLLER